MADVGIQGLSASHHKDDGTENQEKLHLGFKNKMQRMNGIKRFENNGRLGNTGGSKQRDDQEP